VERPDEREPLQGQPRRHRRVCAQPGPARPGSIILAHDTGPSNRLVTIDNLDAIITGLKADGFAFTTVSELCGLR
jgi:peptidoglycan/xylan/chitin deacetylase (PgdA/CDA1 family)